jgi:hypothetical protein
VALNTIYQLRDIQELDGKTIENVYYFNRSGGTGSAINLALAFETEFLPFVLACQVAYVSHVGLSVINLGDLGDFQQLPLVTAGTYSGDDHLPTFNAIGFSMKLNTRAVKGGSKRITGIAEPATTKDLITAAPLLAAVESLRDAFATDIVSAGNTWQPVVVKRVRTAISGTVPLQYNYRLPATDGELVYGEVTACLTSPLITSQVSRKK